MQVEHLFSYSLYHELWNQNLVNDEGFIIADPKDLKRYKAFLEEQRVRRGAENHKNRKQLLDEAQELLKFENLTPGQQENLLALLKSLDLEFGGDGCVVVKPDVRRVKKYPGVREPSLSLWELKLEEAERAKRTQKQDLRRLDKWLSEISNAKVEARVLSFHKTKDWKELDKKCRKRTRDRINEMEIKRRNKINEFHADSDYEWKKICGMKASQRKDFKKSPEKTPLRKAVPHIMGPPKSAVDRGFGIPRKEKQRCDKRDEIKKFSKDTTEDASSQQNASETVERVDANLDDSTSPKIFEKEKVFAFGDHVGLSLAERDARRRERIRKRLELFRKMISRKTGDQKEMKEKKEEKLDEPLSAKSGKTAMKSSSANKKKLGARGLKTNVAKDVRKVDVRKKFEIKQVKESKPAMKIVDQKAVKKGKAVSTRETADVVSVKEEKDLSDDEKGFLREEESPRKSPKKIISDSKSEDREYSQKTVEDIMTKEVTPMDGSREMLVITETLNDVLDAVDLNVDTKLKDSSLGFTSIMPEVMRDLFTFNSVVSSVESLKNVRQSLPVVSTILNMEVANLIKEVSSSVERIVEQKKKSANLLPLDKVKSNLSLTYEEERDEIKKSTHETIGENLEIIETFDELLNSVAQEKPTEYHLEDIEVVDKEKSTNEIISGHKENIENLVKDLIKDLVDKLIETEEVYRTVKRMEHVKESEAPKESTDVDFMIASRIVADHKSFEDAILAEPEICTLDEITAQYVSVVKYTNLHEESLNDVDDFSQRRTDREKADLKIHEKYSSEVLAVQLIKGRQNLALSENLESIPFVESKTNICTVEEIAQQRGSPYKLENMTEVLFRNVHAVRDVPLELLVRGEGEYSVETPVEDIFEAKPQLIVKERDSSKDFVKSSLDDEFSGVKDEFEEIYLGVNSVSSLRKQDDTKRKSMENLFVLDRRRHEVPISLVDIPRLTTDDRKHVEETDKDNILKLSDGGFKDGAILELQDLQDLDLYDLDTKAHPSRIQLNRSFKDSTSKSSLEKRKGERLSIPRDQEDSSKVSFPKSDPREARPSLHDCLHTIGETLKNAGRKLSILANKTTSLARELDGRQQIPRRSSVLHSRSKTKLKDQRYQQKDDGVTKIEPQPSTSRTFPSRRQFKEIDSLKTQPSTSTSSPEEASQKYVSKWPAIVKVETKDIAGLSTSILEKTRAMRANKGLILNKSLFTSLDERKSAKKDE